MLEIKYYSSFKNDYKRIKKRGYKISLLKDVVNLLIKEIPLPAKYKDHKLSGEYDGLRECHITPDWLLIYKIDADYLTLILMRTGTHSDLFKK